MTDETHAPARRTPLDLAGAAEYINISPRLLRSFVFQRKVPFTKVGRLLRFRPDDLDAWLEDNTHAPSQR